MFEKFNVWFKEQKEQTNFKELFTKEFWNQKESSFQVVHMCNGLLFTLLFTNIFSLPVVLLLLLVFVLIVEGNQFFGVDNYKLKIVDRLRDIAFWFIGSGVYYILLYYFKWKLITNA